MVRVVCGWLAAAFLAVAVNGLQPAMAAEPALAAPAVDFAPEYRLGSGDKIRVITFGEESLTGEFFVGGEGKVSLPLVGELPAVAARARQARGQAPPRDEGMEGVAESDEGTMPPPAKDQRTQEVVAAAAEAATKGAAAAGAAQR